MFRIRPNKKSLFCIAAVAVLVLGVCGFAYYNFATRLGKLNAEIAKKEQKLKSSEDISRRLTAVEQEYTAAQVKLGTLEKGVTTKEYVPTLLKQIEALGKSVDMRVVGVRPKPAAPAPPPPPPTTTSSDGKTDAKPVVRKAPDPYEKLDIDIEVTGKYSDVARFLYKVTSFPKIIAVNTVEMSPAGSSSMENKFASPRLSIKLGTTAFILKEAAAKPRSTEQKTASAGSDRS